MADHLTQQGRPAGLLAPMLATLGPLPTGPGWAFEIKFDGVRTITYAGPRGVRLLSRNDNDVTTSYPEVAGMTVPDGLVLDGEIVALDPRGRPDFALLQRRMHNHHPTPALRAEVPAQYVVFDVLRRAGTSVMELPYLQRRAILTELDLTQPGLTVPANFLDTPGELVMAAVEQQGLEGVVAKRLTSTYQPGRRTRTWIKTALRRTAEVVIVGWTPSSGNQRALGSLQLAVHDQHGELVFSGDVGTGFTDTTRRHLLDRLRPLQRDRPAFPGPTQLAHAWVGRTRRGVDVCWVEPRLVGEIEYRTYTPGGGFRHPSWRGLRPDRAPAEVRQPTTRG